MFKVRSQNGFTNGKLFVQDDELFAMLTVEETLMFSAGVRLPASVPYEEKKARVKQLISQLGLDAVAGTIIGNANTRGISGGERRRVSIGVIDRKPDSS